MYIRSKNIYVDLCTNYVNRNVICAMYISIDEINMLM